MSNPDELATNLSRNLRQLRELRGYTQARLSSVSGVPRPTIAALEVGGSNPTLAVLCQVAAGLQVTIEVLISPPRDLGRLYKSTELPTRETRGVQFRQLVPDSIPGITLERMAFPPRARVTGVPHPAGTREYLICEAGRLVLTTEARRWTLAEGDVVVYRGDQSHGYHNPHDEPAVVFTMVMPG